MSNKRTSYTSSSPSSLDAAKELIEIRADHDSQIDALKTEFEERASAITEAAQKRQQEPFEVLRRNMGIQDDEWRGGVDWALDPKGLDDYDTARLVDTSGPCSCPACSLKRALGLTSSEDSREPPVLH